MKKKIMFIIISLVGGGAERVLVDIINRLDAKKYAIYLVLFEKKGLYLSSIPDYVKIYDLKKKNRFSIFRLIFKSAKLLKKIKPDSVFSFMVFPNLIAILAKLISRYRCNLLISIHNHLSSELLYERYKGIKKFLYKNTFKYSNCIIVPSEGVKNDLIKSFNMCQDKIEIIYNPINLDRITRKKNESFKEKSKFGKYILAVGRLTRQKGYPFLLKAYSFISKNIDEKLVILGEGEDETKLKQIAKDLGIHEEIILPGFQKNPYKFMKSASIFVLSSLWEGFAIVIAEAMACDVPVISTDCPSGPGDIITNGKNGLLVPMADEKVLAEAMLSLIKNEKLKKKFSIEGRARAEDFRIERIIPKYEELL